MPFVQRTSSGTVCGVFANAQPGYAEEYLADNDPAVISFLNPPPPVPVSISDRQFFQQLAAQDIISQDEALAAVRTGAIPAPLQQLISAMPADQQFAATMIVSGATTFERNHPLTVTIGTSYGWSSSQIDDFFRSAAAL
jgi:hypothetical protein